MGVWWTLHTAVGFFFPNAVSTINKIPITFIGIRVKAKSGTAKPKVPAWLDGFTGR